MKDPIIEEIHKIRIEYAARFNNDLHAICQDARRKQGKNGHLLAPKNPKPIKKS